MDSTRCRIAGVIFSIRTPFWRRTGSPYLTTERIMGRWCPGSEGAPFGRRLRDRVKISFARPFVQHFYELGKGRALGGADVVTAGGHAREQAEGVVEAEQFPEAKAGVEMVPGAGGDFGFGNVGTFDDLGGVAADGEGIGHRVDDDR